VTDIVIDDLREGTFFAKVRYVYDEEEGQLDARPSDAVALAVRTDAPIFVAAPVLDEAGIPADDDAELPSAFAEEPEPEEEESPPAAKAGTATASGGSKLERMEAQLRKAIDEEDYETAARLRDEIARMRSEN
jgi:bifunctional DNase/RNase